MNAQSLLPLTTSLPLPPANANARRRSLGAFALDADEMAHFNALLAAINAAAPHIEADQVLTLARWLQDKPCDLASALLAEPLGRARMLQSMLQDSDWDAPHELRQRASLLLDYVRRTDDLIPDMVPLLGQLDDALLVELSWQAFAGEAQDYQDYCQYRSTFHPRGTPTERRLAWEAEVLAQANTMLERRRQRGVHYAPRGAHTSLLRVC